MLIVVTIAIGHVLEDFAQHENAHVGSYIQIDPSYLPHGWVARRDSGSCAQVALASVGRDRVVIAAISGMGVVCPHLPWIGWQHGGLVFSAVDPLISVLMEFILIGRRCCAKYAIVSYIAQAWVKRDVEARLPPRFFRTGGCWQ